MHSAKIMEGQVATMSVIAAPPANEEPAPIAPPRRKRANSVPKQHQIGAEVETSSCNKDSAAAKRSQCSSPTPKSSDSDIDPSMKGSSDDSTNSRSSIAAKPRHQELWIKSGSKTLPRIENYYTRIGPEMRRKTSEPPTNVVPLDQLAPSSCTATTRAVEKSATPSPIHGAALAVEKESPTSGSKPPPSVRPYAGPWKGTAPSTSHSRKPPRPPAPYKGCANKTAPYSQLYGTTVTVTDSSATTAATTVVVIDSKAVDAGGERSLSATPRSYGKLSGSHTSGQSSNRDNASIVFGKKTQAALNKLVATMKRFQGSGSGSSKLNQKTSPVGKSNADKTPPKRPPPAVRNTPRPPIPKATPSSNDGSDVSPCATFTVDGSEEDPYVNSYDDHTYMEVGKMAFKTNMRVGSRSGMEEGDDDDEDAYVIMNPGENSHIYTPLAFDMRSKSTDVYEVLRVSRTDKECATTSLEGSGYLDDDNSYVSPEELKRYQVATTLHDHDEEDNCCAIEDDEETYVDMRIFKSGETFNYKNAAAIVGSKQSSDNRLSPTKSVTPTHKMVTDR